MHFQIYSYGRTDRRTVGRTDRQTDGLTDRPMDRPTNQWTDRPTNRQTDRYVAKLSFLLFLKKASISKVSAIISSDTKIT